MDDNRIATTVRMNYMKKSYMDKVFDSCVDVSFPQTNGKVVEDLMCEGNTGDDCNAKVFQMGR